MHDHLREHDGQCHHQHLDADKGHGAPIDLAGCDRLDLLSRYLVEIRHFGGNGPQIEQCETERRMHEARLHIDAKKNAEPDQIDAEFVRGRSEQWHDDEGKFEEVEEERQEEDEEVDDNQKSDFAARQRYKQMLNPYVSVDAIERQ